MTAASKCWDLTRNAIPGVQLGGICVDKPYYHNRRNRLLSYWGRDYSCTLPIDLDGPGDVCAAVDLTIHDNATMEERCRRLKAACLDPLDDRTKYIREFIGTLNSTNVICYIHNTELGSFNLDTGRDSSHLWHIHISFFRRYAHLDIAGEAIASVLNGETYSAWLTRKGLPGGTHPPLTMEGDMPLYLINHAGKGWLSNTEHREWVDNMSMFRLLRDDPLLKCIIYPGRDPNSADGFPLPLEGRYTPAEVDLVFGRDVATLPSPATVDAEALASAVAAQLAAQQTNVDLNELEARLRVIIDEELDEQSRAGADVD